MSKADPTQQALHAVAELRHASSPEQAKGKLSAYLRHRSNLVVAKAAKVAAQLRLSGLVVDLVAAFHRFMANPAPLDKRCAALAEIVAALYELDYREPEIYLQGLRHVQKEASFGPPVDAAAALRGISAQGLARTQYPTALQEVVSLLVDPEPPARLGAIRALAVNGGEAGLLLLRLKVLTGDPEADVMAECFAGLLTAGPEQSLPFVVEYLDDEDPQIAEAAIWALGESRLAAGLEVLRQKWERAAGRPLRKLLLAAIAALRLQESLDFLLSLVQTADTQSACDAVVALAIYKENESVRRSVASAAQSRGERLVTDMFEHHFRS